MGGVALFVSNLNWLDPQITPLVPVLKSYWLMIHVSVVTASYGFFGICAACGIASLAATAFGRNLRELRAINEMAMIVGLALLTAGISSAPSGPTSRGAATGAGTRKRHGR